MQEWPSLHPDANFFCLPTVDTGTTHPLTLQSPESEQEPVWSFTNHTAVRSAADAKENIKPTRWGTGRGCKVIFVVRCLVRFL